MGYIGRGQPSDIPIQGPGSRLIIRELKNLTLDGLTVISGANLPPFNQLIVVASGTSALGTVQSGVWNADVITEAYGGTGKSTYQAGDLLLGNSSNGLDVLASGAEGLSLQVKAGAVQWATPSTSNVLSSVSRPTGLTYTISNSEYVVSISGSTTVNMPPSPEVGQAHIVKDGLGVASTSNILVSGNGNPIDGESSQSLVNDYQSFTLVWDVAQWIIV